MRLTIEITRETSSDLLLNFQQLEPHAWWMFKNLCIRQRHTSNPLGAGLHSSCWRYSKGFNLPQDVHMSRHKTTCPRHGEETSLKSQGSQAFAGRGCDHKKMLLKGQENEELVMVAAIQPSVTIGIGHLHRVPVVNHAS